jgi:signal peptidase I
VAAPAVVPIEQPVEPPEETPVAAQEDTKTGSDAGQDQVDRVVPRTTGKGCLALFLGLIFVIGGARGLLWYGRSDSFDVLKFLISFGFVGAGVAFLVPGLRFISTSRPAPWLAAVLTLVTPGLGQVYGREPKRALAIFLGWIGVLVGFQVSGLVKIFAGLIALIVLFLLFLDWVRMDAYRIARQQADSLPRPHSRWSLVYLAVVLVSVYFAPYIIGVRGFTSISGNMEPVVSPGDHFFADLNAYLFARPARGDLVIFASPEEPARLQVARVIGLEGEDVAIQSKAVYINSQPLPDPWGQHNDPSMFAPRSFSAQGYLRDHMDLQKIPKDSVFVLGDNRDNSYDSRFFGPVSISSIRGRPLYVYWVDKWRYIFSDFEKSRIGTSLR